MLAMEKEYEKDSYKNKKGRFRHGATFLCYQRKAMSAYDC